MNAPIAADLMEHYETRTSVRGTYFSSFPIQVG